MLTLTPLYHQNKNKQIMQHRNIRRAVLYRLAMTALCKRKRITLRPVHSSVLYLVHEHCKNGSIGASASELHLLLRLLRMGGHYPFFAKVLQELQCMDMVRTDSSGKVKRYHTTATGKIFLNDLEKSLRICRTDRRILKPKKV